MNAWGDARELRGLGDEFVGGRRRSRKVTNLKDGNGA